jgi:hypothetical protein
VTTWSVLTRQVRMAGQGLSGLVRACQCSFPKDKRSNDVLFHQATPHVNLRRVPLMFDNFVTWLDTVIYMFRWNVASSDKHTECREISYHCQFSAEFPRKLSFCIQGQVFRCVATKAITTHINVDMCVQRNELRACLYESIFFGYMQMLAFTGCHCRSWRFLIATSSD